MSKKWLGICFFILSSCGSKQEVLRIYNWIDYISPEIYKQFEQETGIQVLEDAVTSSEEIYAKVKAGASNFDLIVPSLNYATIMIEEGLIAPVDKAAVPNITNVEPFILDELKTVDPGQEYIVPFVFGPTVIAYDSSVIQKPVKGFEIYENPNYKGRMMMLGEMREVMSSALLITGHQPGDYSPQAMSDAESLIKKWKQNILRFDSDSFQVAYANGEVDVVQGYIDTIWPSLGEERRKVTKFVIPDKGAMAWIDTFLILKNAPNKDAAMKFINFIHRPDIYAKLADYLGVNSINIPARSLMETQPLVPYEEMKRTTLLKEIGNEALAVQSRVWENIQAE